MEKTNFEGLQPEIFYAQPWFADFMEVYAQVLDDRIRYPIYQLERIRDITEQSDSYVIMQTLKQIGFDLPTDFVRHNLNRLAQSIPQLTLYAERSGTNDYARTMSFIYGRSIDATTLYTEDYTNFYTQPYGPLQVDGGEWYKTTHVELGMQMLASDYSLLLPRNKTIKDRFLEAFYEFAPWNVVVERFHFNVDIEIPLFITGRIIKQPKRYIDVGIGDLKVTDMKIIGPGQVYESSTHEYELYVTLENGSGSTVEIFPRRPLLGVAGFAANEEELKTFTELSNYDQIVTLTVPDNQYGYLCYPKSMGLATFTDTNLGIEGGWDGASWPDGDIGDQYGPIVVSRTIGDTTSDWYLYRTDFSALGTVEYEVKFDNPGVDEHDTVTTESSDTYVTQTVQVKGNWSSNRTGLVDWTDGFASFGNVGLDTSMLVYAEYQGRSVSKAVLVKNNTSNVRSIEIVGPDSVRAMESESYQVIAHTDSGEEVLDVPINTVSVYGYMEGNLLHIYQINEDSPVYLRAELTLPDGQVLKATRRITALYVDPELHLTNLEITGPSEFYENEQKQYHCIAHYSDGSSEGVLAVWNSGCAGVYITPSGELFSSTTESDLNLTLKATHQSRNVTLTAELPVQFKRREITVTHTEILGPNTVIELTKNQFQTVARFSDGSTGVIEAEWSSDRYYINDRGELEVGSVGTTPIQLTVRSRVDGRLAIKQVTAINTPVTLDNLLITGPDDLREGASGKFTAYAHYSNGRDIEIAPEWSIRGNPSWVSIDANGLLSFSDPEDGIIEVSAVYRVAGRVLTQTKPLVLVPKTRIIQGLLVSGPNEVFEGERIYLTGTAVYSDGKIETVSPLWSVSSADPLNDPEAMADIVSPGVLQGRTVYEDTKVVAIARYFKEIAEFEITVKPKIENSPDKPVSSRIIGPAAFYSDQRGSYSHMILFEECPAELAVSSDWSIDVGPDVAVIDNAGFLWSVNGRSAVVTVTSTYTCGTYTVVDSFLVNILGQADVLKELIIIGPDAVIGDQQTLYTAELFKTGEVVEPGKGLTVAAEWSIVNPDGRVAVNGSGQVYVVDASSSFTFILKAMYQEGFEKVEATKEINVIRNARPIFGVGPIGVRNDPEIADYLDKELPTVASGQRFTLTAGSGQYMYFCYPASLGLAEFIDTASQFVGGWDGASWPDDGSVGEQMGPIAIQRKNELGISSTWYLYRTDFDGIGTYTYEVTFGH